MRYVDLFCGLGSFHIAMDNVANRLNIKNECVMSCDLKEIAKKVYYDNFDVNCLDDITKIKEDEIPDFDVLCAGFPCQPFSTAGHRLGFEDTRGTLFFEIARILKAKSPKYFILENVEGLLTHNKGQSFETIVRILQEDLHYYVYYDVLNAYDYGCPQARKRLFIIGTKTEIQNDLFKNNRFYNTKTMQEIISNHANKTLYLNNDFSNKLQKNYSMEQLYGKSINDKRGGENNIHSWNIDLKGKINDTQKDILSFILYERRKRYIAHEQGIEWKDGCPLTFTQIYRQFPKNNLDVLLKELVDLKYLKYDYPEVSKKKDTTKEKGYSISSGKLSFPITYILNNNSYAPTLTATDLPHIGLATPSGLRTLDKDELKRLFCFPQSYNLDNIPLKSCYDLFGNTICVNVLENIIFNLLDGN